MELGILKRIKSFCAFVDNIYNYYITENIYGDENVWKQPALPGRKATPPLTVKLEAFSNC